MRKAVAAVALVIVGILGILLLGAAASVYVLNRTNGSFRSSGRQRDYLLHVPAAYDRNRPTPLVISLHGAMLWPAAQMATSQWNRLADRYGFIVVYPAGGFGVLAKAWPIDGGAGRDAEVRFIGELIDTLEHAYAIDRTRIYVNGLSNGGGMAFVLSCTIGNRIAAVGTVAAAQTVPSTWCPDRRPVPLVAFHGTADPIVPYGGGKVWSAPRPFPGAREWTADWARRNGCSPDAIESSVARDVTRRQYSGCSDNADVVLYSISGGGHAWPGGTPMPRWIVGRTTTTIDATAEMWAFFARHRLRDAALNAEP